MEDFTKVLRMGTAPIGKARASVFFKVEYRDGRLSVTGVEGPRKSGNCLGGCGQIDMYIDADYLDAVTYAPGWDRETAEQFLKAWHDWHLNHTQAGSPRQTAELEKHAYPRNGIDYFTWAKHVLCAAGLEPDTGYLHNGKPYRYGSAWLRKEVPPEVLEFLRSLPDADKQPAWV